MPRQMATASLSLSPTWVAALNRLREASPNSSSRTASERTRLATDMVVSIPPPACRATTSRVDEGGENLTAKYRRVFSTWLMRPRSAITRGCPGCDCTSRWWPVYFLRNSLLSSSSTAARETGDGVTDRVPDSIWVKSISWLIWARMLSVWRSIIPNSWRDSLLPEEAMLSARAAMEPLMVVSGVRRS